MPTAAQKSATTTKVEPAKPRLPKIERLRLELEKEQAALEKKNQAKIAVAKETLRCASLAVDKAQARVDKAIDALYGLGMTEAVIDSFIDTITVVVVADAKAENSEA